MNRHRTLGTLAFALSAVWSASALAQSAGPYYTNTAYIGNDAYVQGSASCNAGDVALYSEAWALTSSGAASTTLSIQQLGPTSPTSAGLCAASNPHHDNAYCAIVCKHLEAGETSSTYYAATPQSVTRTSGAKGNVSITTWCNGTDPIVGGGFHLSGADPGALSVANGFPNIDGFGRSSYYAGGYWSGGGPATLTTYATCKTGGNPVREYYMPPLGTGGGKGAVKVNTSCSNTGDYPLISGCSGGDIQYTIAVQNDLYGGISTCTVNGNGNGGVSTAVVCRVAP